MDIQDTRKCNHWNLQLLSRYLNVETDVLVGYYHELLENSQFINSLNDQVIHVREHTGFEKGIFKMTRIPSADWFAFERILIYVLIRHQRPEVVLETGVYYGGNSAFALLALQRNEKGRMISIDYPDSQIRKCGPSKTRHPLVGDSELYTEALRPGFIVPDYLKVNWHLIEGDSLEVIPNIDVTFDFYIHDSDHSMPFLSKELNAVFS